MNAFVYVFIYSTLDTVIQVTENNVASATVAHLPFTHAHPHKRETSGSFKCLLDSTSDDYEARVNALAEIAISYKETD